MPACHPPHGLLVVVVAHPAGHHVAELRELDLARAVCVELVDHLEELGLGGGHAHAPHGVAQLPGGDGPTPVSVKHVERLS